MTSWALSRLAVNSTTTSKRFAPVILLMTVQYIQTNTTLYRNYYCSKKWPAWSLFNIQYCTLLEEDIPFIPKILYTEMTLPTRSSHGQHLLSIPSTSYKWNGYPHHLRYCTLALGSDVIKCSDYRWSSNSWNPKFLWNGVCCSVKGSVLNSASPNLSVTS